MLSLGLWPLRIVSPLYFTAVYFVRPGPFAFLLFCYFSFLVTWFISRSTVGYTFHWPLHTFRHALLI